MEKVAGTLDIILAGLAGAKTVLDGIDGQYVPMGAEAVTTAALGYTALKDFTGSKLYANGMLVAGGGLCAAGTAKILSGINEQKPSRIVNGALDLALGGFLLGIYYVRTRINRKATK